MSKTEKFMVLGRSLLVALLLTSCRVGRETDTHSSSETRSLRPINVVLVTIDTLRADRLACYGYSRIQTLTLDRLAKRGVLFENAVSQVPLTPPSHASMFTGAYPTVHKVRDTGGFVLDPSQRTLAEILKAHGWETGAIVGASVLGRQFGFNQGFDYYDDQMPKPQAGMAAPEFPERSGKVVVDRALEWMGQRSRTPFFLWVHLYDPHAPYDPPLEFKRKYAARPYDGEVAYVDVELGRLFDQIEKKFSLAQTLIAVVSDHGESLSEHGEYSHGVFLYDSTLRIPFLLAGAGVPPGLRVRQQARTVDLAPTLLELLGGEAPAGCQGTSLVPAFSGQGISTTYSYAESLYPKINMGWAELRSVRTSKWKYIQAPQAELYDLEHDPGEITNVIQRFPEEAQRLKYRLGEIIGQGQGPEKVELKLMNSETEKQLRSLGYVSAGAPSRFELTGNGIDPKDRVHVLQLLDEAIGPGKKTDVFRRIQLLRQAQTEDSANSAIYLALGDAYEKSKRYKEALKLYEAAAKQGVKASKLYSRMANIYMRQGKREEAIAAYESAAAINPTDADSQSNLATAYMEKGRIADAERVFKAILVLNDQYAAAHNGLAVIAIQKGDGRTARQHFEQALRLDPDLLEAQLNVAVLYKQAGELALAREGFKKFLAKAPQHQYREVIPKVAEELAALQ